jgi:hypothetical protein
MILTKRSRTGVPDTSEEDLRMWKRSPDVSVRFTSLRMRPTHEDAPDFVVDRYQTETSDDHQTDPA